MKRRVALAISSLILATKASSAALVGAGLSSTPVGSGSYGVLGWDFPTQSEFAAGVFGRFSLLRVNNYAIAEDNRFANTLSDKAELGFTLGRRVQSYQPYFSAGAVYLLPDKALASQKSWGGFGALGIKFHIDERFGFQIEQSANFGLGRATTVAGAPNLFNIATTSLGVLIKV